MLSAPATTARYWTCGGEIFALGGPIPLTVAGRAVGCRSMSRGELRRLTDWHQGQAGAYHRHCQRDAQAVLATLVDVPS
jgi:hypothetical protein